MGSIFRVFVVSAALGVVMLVSAGTASAACGNNISFYTSNDNAWQKLVYSNCTGSSVRRRAIVNNWADGSCVTIPAHSSRTLMNIRYYMWNPITHSRSC